VPGPVTDQAIGSPVEVTKKMVAIPGGTHWLGNDSGEAFADDGEGPVRKVTVSDFFLDPCAVTNQQFARFVKATGYLTEAEQIGWSYVFYQLVDARARASIIEAVVPGAPWWCAVRGASWRAPSGPGSAPLPNHPVVHTSWNDAQAYASWARKRLPTETEWEVAARGGLDRAIYPWGDELAPRGQHRCNTWRGTFPTLNTLEDGYLGTAPVNAFRPNGYSLYNMAGNVWEWCSDWWSNSWHVEAAPATRLNPKGPPSGISRVIRGGSYLCHESYCNRYRVAARTSNTPDSSTGHMGFRCAATAA
jgi:formylglycine-generating enzyme required for sulfatase activity